MKKPRSVEIWNRACPPILIGIKFLPLQSSSWLESFFIPPLSKTNWGAFRQKWGGLQKIDSHVMRKYFDRIKFFEKILLASNFRWIKFKLSLAPVGCSELPVKDRNLMNEAGSVVAPPSSVWVDLSYRNNLMLTKRAWSGTAYSLWQCKGSASGWSSRGSTNKIICL